jgi:hypothetical protein
VHRAVPDPLVDLINGLVHTQKCVLMHIKIICYYSW